MLGKLTSDERADKEAEYPATKRAAQHRAGAPAPGIIRISAYLVAQPGTKGPDGERANQPTLLPVGGLDLSRHSVGLFGEQRTWGQRSA